MSNRGKMIPLAALVEHNKYIDSSMTLGCFYLVWKGVTSTHLHFKATIIHLTTLYTFGPLSRYLLPERQLFKETQVVI